LEVFGRHHRNGQHLRVGHLGQLMTAMVEPLQQCVDQDKGRYIVSGNWFVLCVREELETLSHQC
jgi:hypothetical protein